MSDNTAGDQLAGKKMWRNFGITVAVIAVVLVVMITASPRGFERDLTKIGTGVPALVLVYDPNLVVTGEQLHEFNQVREEFEASMHFLLADVGYEQARAFTDAYDTHPGVILLFSPEGEVLTRLVAPVPAERLRQELPSFLE